MAEVFPGHSQLIADMFQEFSAEDVENVYSFNQKTRLYSPKNARKIRGVKKVVKTKRAGPKAEQLLVSIWRILGRIGRV